MIDRSARDLAYDLLTKIQSETLTNWQLEDRWPKSETDPSINCILRWLWTLYEDDKEIVLRNEISVNDLNIIERCLEFLRSDVEFPTKTLSISEANKIRKRWGIEWRTDCTFPDNETWPFPKT